MKKTLIYTCLLSLFLPPLLPAEVINLTNTSADSLWPAISVNSRGQVMMVWSEGGTIIWYRLYDNGSWSTPRNAGITNQKAWSNRLDKDSTGTFHCTWADGYGSGGRDIWYSYFTGSSWTTAERTYRSADNSAWNYMSIDKNNDIHVMWYHKYAETEWDSDIITMKKPKGGNWPSSYENVSRSKPTETIHPAFRVLNGRISAVYMDGGSGDRKLTFAEKKNGSWSTPIVLDRQGYYPAMVLDGSGNVHAAYSNRSKNFWVISREGSSWGSPRVVSGGETPLQFGDIQYANGILVAAFIQKSGDNWATNYAAKFGGNPWSKSIQVSSGDNYGDGNRHVQVAVDDQGYAHFLWEGKGVGGKFDIFYSKVKLSEPDFPFMELDKTYLHFQAQKGGTAPTQAIGIRNSGQGSFSYTVSSNRNWLTVSPGQGGVSSETDYISIDIDTGTRPAGLYDGTITISSPEAGNSPALVTVDLVIEKPTDPRIELNKPSLSFTGFALGDNPAPQTFGIRNSGADTLSYEITVNKSWLGVTPTTGASTGEFDTITVSVNNAGLGQGSYAGQLQVRAPGAENTPQYINVTLQLERPPDPFPPLNVAHTKFGHEGLFLKVYKTTVTWRSNPENIGLFNINFHRVYRRESGSADYTLIKQANSDVFTFTDVDFSSAEERDRYVYAVTCVDVDGRESAKNEALVTAKKNTARNRGTPVRNTIKIKNPIK
jgi:hypothetical protein